MAPPDDTPAGTHPLRRVALTLREPHFPVLWLSNLVQYCAWTAWLVMLQWLVTSLTDSRTILGSVATLSGAVIFLSSPLAGVAADRLPRRNLLLAGRLVLATLTLAVAGLVAAERIAVWHLLAAVAVAGGVTALLQPATQAFVFDVVRRERAPNAVALNVAAQGLGHTLGPLWGGGLMAAAGFVAAYVSAGAGVVVAALLLLWVPERGAAARDAARSWWADLREGLAWVARNPPMRLALFTVSLAIFNGSVGVMRPAFARDVLGADATGYGVLAGTAGLGSLATAFVMAALPMGRRPGLVMVWSMLGYSLCILLYSLAFSFAYLLAVELLIGVFSQVWNVYTFSGLQMAAPDALRGRIVSLVFTLSMLASVGGVFVGLLADALGDQPALAVFGAVPALVLVAVLALGSARLREL